MKTFLRTGASVLTIAAFGAALLAAHPAAAQSAAQMQAIQQQIQDLQAQLKKLQADAARRDAELKQAKDEAMMAKMQAVPPAVAAIPAGAGIVTMPANDKDAAGKPVFNPNKPNGRFNLGAVTVQLGGYIDVTGLYRSRDQNNGVATSFTGLPLANSPNYRTGELRATAQQTRFSALLDSTPYDGAKLDGYVETDLQSAGSSSNSNQTNSYTMRLRQAYTQLDDKGLGVHLLAGQAWSFLTPFKSGLNARAENVPPALENSIIQGFAYARQPQVRVTADVASWASLGVSIEAPQSTFSGTAPTLANGATILTTSAGYGINSGQSIGCPAATTAAAKTSCTTANVGKVSSSNVGVSPNSPALSSGTVAGGGLNPLATYSYNTLPDVIVKAAVDPSFGHFEAFGIARFFKDEQAYAGGGGDLKATGGGFGVAAFIPVVPGLIDLSGNLIAGNGLGRYGSGGLPDATYKANGAPEPLPEVMAMVGVVGHATPKLDLFAFAGSEAVKSKVSQTAGVASFGYGDGFNNSGCGSELSTATCKGYTKAVNGFQVGGWYSALKGGYGTLNVGASYEYYERDLFASSTGTTGPSKVSENVFLVTLRYLPFQ